MDKYKILLADDEPQSIQNWVEILSEEPYRLFVASNGKEAVELTIRHKPDAIIMDWDMPEMDGLEAIKTIRATKEIEDIPVIIATGKMLTVENLRTALESGANDYIQNSYDLVEITARINSMIRLSEEQQKNIRFHREVFQKQTDILKSEIEISNQALSASKLRLLNNYKNNERIINELQKITACTNGEIKNKITSLISWLKANASTINWQEIESHFGKVHPSFFTTLREKFPGLTPNEKELCVFIKMDMTTHEIMAITYKTDNALKKSRQRLKKKLGLGSEQSLYHFIQQIN